MSEIEPQLRELAAVIPNENRTISDARWDKLADNLRQVIRLTGSILPGKARWRDLRRHLSFGQGTDLHDIARLDWPSVRQEIEANLYSELEPLPVGVANLGDLVQTKPSGPVTTKLNWSAIDDEEFERLLFNLVADASGWRMASPRPSCSPSRVT